MNRYLITFRYHRLNDEPKHEVVVRAENFAGALKAAEREKDTNGVVKGVRYVRVGVEELGRDRG